MKQVLLFFIMFFITASCAVIKKKQCLPERWKTYGREDALAGHQRSYFFERDKSCRSIGRSGDRKAYIQGYEEVRETYCRYENGHSLGLAGRPYNKICTGDYEDRFFRGYFSGKKSREREEYYRKETRLQRDESSFKKTLDLRFEANLERRACRWAEECVISDRCVDKICQKSERSCVAHSDCRVEGDCSRGVCEY